MATQPNRNRIALIRSHISMTFISQFGIIAGIAIDFSILLNMKTGPYPYSP